MDKLMRGKCLVRKSKTSKGDDVVTLTGVFYPQNTRRLETHLMAEVTVLRYGQDLVEMKV